MEEYEECEILWNYLPEGTIYALTELDQDLLEFFNLKGTYQQLIVSTNNPANAYVIQGEVLLINTSTMEIYYTNDSVCVANQDIITYYKEPLQCLQQQHCLK